MDLVPAEAQWHMGQVENHARYLRVLGNRMMEDMDIDAADLPKVAGPVDGCEKHHCRMAAVEVEANAHVSKNLVGMSD